LEQRLLTGVSISPAHVHFASDDHISHSAEEIHQEPVFKASRKKVYEPLTDAKQFGEVTRLSAIGMELGTTATEIGQKVGGTFILFGGHIFGRQLELIPGERIVQAWRVVDWKPGDYSIAKFELSEVGSGTKIIFDHLGFPEGMAEHLASEWSEHYWTPLSKYLGS
jgi:activator of HSP90 ATPase